ncbi:DUF4426 domain-containing protein [Parashewanella spongiae]|uniref:DUF4426 domain-containing protein n=1 Tax=Parashewanella spongiae TaxID=342950 RepID=A0A3A6U8Y0_9GAMM|nr:DUF4426 domain-containing protein [Parashewanella spongiae]MCL1078310.1 DUF4426 domain-containing protein [Parashewanella spongiae]RJY15033.1 DUF4426 domain-containing protein [Parashewanella spongiae]
MLKNLCAILMLTAGLFGVAQAEQKTVVGNFDIHYMAFGSTFLTPSIAKTYNIKRSQYTGIVNITVLDNRLKNKPSVPVKIDGVAKNILDSHINLEFKEVREGDATYYIAEVPYRDDGTINFDINIMHGKELSTKVKFKQKFYVE